VTRTRDGFQVELDLLIPAFRRQSRPLARNRTLYAEISVPTRAVSEASLVRIGSFVR